MCPDTPEQIFRPEPNESKMKVNNTYKRSKLTNAVNITCKQRM